MDKKFNKKKLKRSGYLAIALVLVVTIFYSFTIFSNSENETEKLFGGHVHALAINPETGDLFLGARPLYKSNDSGKTWTEIELPKSQERANVVSVAIDSKNPNIMYASGHGHSVVKSIDGGNTWEIKNEGIKEDSIEAIAIDSQDSNKLYAWALGEGLYRSENAGELWERVDDGPKNQEIRSLASVNLETGMGGIWIYAALDDGVKKSPDCFCGWETIPNQGLPEGKRVYSLSADKQNNEILYAGLREGIFKTEDAGESWNKVLDDVADAIVTVHPTNPNIVYASSDVGEIFFSNDAGQNWEKINVEKVVR